MAKIGATTTIQISRYERDHLKRIKESYNFDSIEQTVNVIMDFTQDHMVTGEFHEYVKKHFPSKF